MGILSKLFGPSGNATSSKDRSGADAFSRGRRVSSRHAETYAKHRSGSSKSLAQQSKEHKRGGKK